MDGVLEVSRRTCFDNAIKVAQIFGVYCQKFDVKTMFVTGMQHAATAAIAIVEGMTIDNSKNRAEHLLHLQCLAEALHAHSVSYFPAKRMSNILFNVIGEYRRNQICSGTQSPADKEQIESFAGAGDVNFENRCAPETSTNFGERGQRTGGVDEMIFFPGGVPYLATPGISNHGWSEPVVGGEQNLEVLNHPFSSDDEIWTNIMQTLQPMEMGDLLE